MEVSCRTDEIMMADHNETKVFQIMSFPEVHEEKMEIVAENQFLESEILNQSESQDFQEHLFGVLKTLREDLEQVSSHYQELIVVSREALKRKRQIENQFTQLKQTIQEMTQQNEELTRRVADLEANHLKAKRKTQALEGIALLVEATKYL